MTSVLVLSGPSGVGKGTVIKAVLAARPDVRLSVSATTRTRRAGEADGVDYHFVTKEHFARMLLAGDLLEQHVRWRTVRHAHVRAEPSRLAAHRM